MINYDIRSLSSVKHLRACCFVLFGLVYSFQVSAQSAGAGDVFSWVYYQTSGNTTSVNAGGTSSTAVRDMGWGPSASSGNSVNWKGSPTIRNGSGNPLVVDVIARTPGAKAAKILSAGAKVLPIIGTGVMLWDLCNELGFQCSKSSGGEPIIQRKSSSATCNVYYPPSSYSSYTNTKVCLPSSSGSGVYEYGWAISGGVFGDGPSWPCGNITCQVGGPYQGIGTTSNVSNEPASSSLQELEDAIAAKSGWPQTSKIHGALREAAQATGQKIPLESPTVSGPSTSKGTTTTTTNPGAGTTTTTTTTHNHTYNDNRVTSTVTTSVNVTNNSTGQGTTTTTTQEPVNEQSECEKNPNSLNCADLDTPTGDIPKKEKRITYAAENLGFAGGSCPADVIRTIGGQQMMLVNWAQNCNYITTYAKPMILAAATFAALMIIFVGGKLE